jgi:hypothetical protein
MIFTDKDIESAAIGIRRKIWTDPIDWDCLPLSVKALYYEDARAALSAVEANMRAEGRLTLDRVEHTQARTEIYLLKLPATGGHIMPASLTEQSIGADMNGYDDKLAEAVRPAQGHSPEVKRLVEAVKCIYSPGFWDAGNLPSRNTPHAYEIWQAMQPFLAKSAPEPV